MHNVIPRDSNIVIKFIFLILISFSILATGCSGCSKSSNSSPNVESVEISSESTELVSNTSMDLGVTTFFDDGSKESSGSEVTWTSSDETVATVSATGVVTAVGDGQVTITVERDGVSHSIELQVTSPTLLSLNVSPPAVDLVVGLSKALSVTAVYDNGTQQNVTESVQWSSADTSIVSVNENVITGVAAGEGISITATLGTVTGSTSVDVEAASLLSLEFKHPPATLVQGQSIDLEVNGIFSNGDVHDISQDVQWAISDVSIVEIKNFQLTTIGTGSFDLIASVGNVSVTQTYTIEAAELQSITLSPVKNPLTAGERIQLTAMGLYSNGKLFDITQQVDWTSSAATIAEISNAIGFEGTLSARAAGSVTVSATLDNVSSQQQITVSNATLLSIKLTWQEITIAKGTTAKLVATGKYSDNTTKDLTQEVAWRTADDTIARINSENVEHNFIYGVSPGTTTVIAQLNSISAQASITVTNAELVEIIIKHNDEALFSGSNTQLIAIGVFSDGSTQDITDQVIWSSNNSDFKINNSDDPGLADLLNSGDYEISAKLGEVTTNTSLTVSEVVIQSIHLESSNNSISLGTTTNVRAIATFSDSSSADVTDEVTFTSSDNTGLTVFNTVSDKGLIKGMAVGQYTVSIINASVNSSSITIVVSDAVLSRIEISPRNFTVPTGFITELTATGIFSDDSQQDLTKQVFWQSANESIAFVSNAMENAGNTVATSVGSTEISATFASIVGTASITVESKPLLNISLFAEDGDADVPVGYSKLLSATANYDDGSNQDVSNQVVWHTSDDVTDAEVCQFSELRNGLAAITALQAGSCTVSATYEDQSASFIFDVSSAELIGLSISPKDESMTTSPVLAKGFNLELVVTGSYSDSTTRDITTDVTLQTSDTDIISLNNLNATVTALSEGVASVTVNHGGQTASISITVSPESLTKIDINTSINTYYKGRLVLFKAIGTFSDDSTQDISSQVLWEVSDESVATIDNASNFGFLQAIGSGAVTVSATVAGVTGELAITIVDSPEVPVSLSLNSSPVAILANGSESSTIAIRVLAADSSVAVLDGTEVEIRIVTRDGVSAPETVTTTDGIATYTFTPATEGVSYILAQIPDSFIVNYIAVFATNDLGKMIGRLRLASVSFNESGQITAGSRIGYYAINLSNRVFDIVGFVVQVGETIIYTSANPATPLGLEDMVLSAGEDLFLGYEFDNEVENAVIAALLLRDQATGNELTILQDYRLSSTGN